MPELVAAVNPYLKRAPKGSEELVYAECAIRALGRLGGPAAEAALIPLLANKDVAAYAAEALGDCGGETAAASLLAAYPDYTFSADAPGRDITQVRKLPAGERPLFDWSDYVSRTAYAISMALARIPFRQPENLARLRVIAPILVQSLPSDFDSTIAYEPEPHQLFVAFLLERSGRRRAALDAAFEALGVRQPDPVTPVEPAFLRLIQRGLVSNTGNILCALCREPQDVPALLDLLEHRNHYVRINVAKALMFLGAREAVPRLRAALETAADDATYGYCGRWDFSEKGGQGQDEFNDPSPRWKEAFLRAYARLAGAEAVPLLERYLRNERNAVEIMYTAAVALGEITTPEATQALRWAAADHPLFATRLVALEALMRRGEPLPQAAQEAPASAVADNPPSVPGPEPQNPPLVFLQGPPNPGNAYQIPGNLQTYTTTDSGPTFRLAKRICRLERPGSADQPRVLLDAGEGWLADLEVSYDGQRLLFSRRGGLTDPWWHLWEMRADGSGMRQITQGPYHDINPNYLPDGNLVCATSRIGMRDEYHGYPATGLATLRPDGSDWRFLTVNTGKDAEPCVALDGRILFVRLEVFYTRMKTEWNLLAMRPDGTDVTTLYGPERRSQWLKWGTYTALAPRHRVLTPSQPQPWSGGCYVVNSFRGPILVGPGRQRERPLALDNTWAITTPYPYRGQLLVGAAPRPLRAPASAPDGRSDAAVAYRLCRLNPADGRLTPLFEASGQSCFEARPLVARPRPPVLQSAPYRAGQPGRYFCVSVFNSREPRLRQARWIRLVEAPPVVARHQTHTNQGVAWKNHGGPLSRILGVLPLAADGSFSVELPSDRMIHFQALDADRRVVGNELIWQHVRPGENRGCAGCHEQPDAAVPIGTSRPAAFRMPSQQLDFPPPDLALRYRAKMWAKGEVRDRDEERMRTVNSVSLPARE